MWYQVLHLCTFLLHPHMPLHSKTRINTTFPSSDISGADPNYFRCQISLSYSAMVLSEEKNPAFATFTSIMRRHFS